MLTRQRRTNPVISRILYHFNMSIEGSVNLSRRMSAIATTIWQYQTDTASQEPDNGPLFGDNTLKWQSRTGNERYKELLDMHFPYLPEVNHAEASVLIAVPHASVPRGVGKRTCGIRSVFSDCSPYAKRSAQCKEYIWQTLLRLQSISAGC